MWILDNCRAADVQNSGNVALNIGGRVVIRTIVGNGHGRSGRIIGKVQGVADHGHLAQAAAVVDVVIGSGTVGPTGPQAICIVSKGPGGGTIGHRCQLTAMLPGVGPSAVGKHIADGVAGNGLAIVARQLIAPTGVAVGVVDCFGGCTQCSGGVGILLAGQNVACIVVCPDPSLSRCLAILPEGLPLRDFGELLG